MDKDTQHAPAGPSSGRIVAVAGLDPAGGAGLLRDAISARSLAAQFHGVPTATTPPTGRHGSVSVEARPPALLACHLAAALMSATGPTAIKIGMVPDGPSARAIASELQGLPWPIVLDPVLASSHGIRLLLGPESASVALHALIRRAEVVTPNRDELSELVDQPVTNWTEAHQAAERLRKMGAQAVLIKGGHLPADGDEVCDVLIDAAGTFTVRGPHVPGPGVRGTGCALSTAIAIHRARGQELRTACVNARAWLGDQLRRAIRVGDDFHLPG